jgi:hypothetical protein
MNARALEEAAARIEGKRRRARQHGALAFAAAPVAALLALGSSRHGLAFAVAVGAIVQIVLAAGMLWSRHTLIERLALDPAAYVIGEVRRFGLRATEPRELAHLAGRLRSVAAEASSPGSVWLADRVEAFTSQLDALARDLLSPSAAVEAPSVVLCRRLLVNAVESPLCNPQIPTEELALALHRIRRGITLAE